MMPGMPPQVQPEGPGQTAPASPMTPQRPAGDTRQSVLMGLALWMMSQAHSAAPLSERSHKIAKSMSDLGKDFQPPANDIGKSEFKFLESQYNPAGPQAAQKPGVPGMPQAPPQAPPVAGPAPEAMAG